jgi:hypothetical protein
VYTSAWYAKIRDRHGSVYPRAKPAYTLSVVEVYRSETQEVIKRFFAHRLSYPACICALDAALAGLIPRLTCEQLPLLRALMLANNETVKYEMRKRGSPEDN